MELKKLVTVIILFSALVIQIVLFLRYLMRLPEDWLGILLYLITIALFVILAFIVFIKSRMNEN